MKLKQIMFRKIFMMIIFFYFSDYPRDSKFFYTANKKVIGKMKDGFKEEKIGEFVGLKAKMYSLVSADGRENKKVKGVNKNVVKNTRQEVFVDVLLNKKMRHSMRRIQSKSQRIGNLDVSRIYVSFFDDKSTYQMIASIVWLIFINIYYGSIKLGKVNEVN